jgi:hypothetical protein
MPTQPWETAKLRFFENLSPQEIDLYKNASLENLFYDASATQKKHARGSRMWRLQERMSPLIDSIEDYGKAMDVFVNTCPIVLSPLWGSIRVVLLVSAISMKLQAMLNCLHIAAEAASFQEKLADCLAQIGDVLPRFRVYEVIFKNHERLLVALSAAYLDVLNFCVATKDFFFKSRRSVSMPSASHTQVNMLLTWSSTPFNRITGALELAPSHLRRLHEQDSRTRKTGRQRSKSCSQD